jgi:hypothetical protein
MIPLKYVYMNNTKYVLDGLDAGIFLMPRVDLNGNNIAGVNKIGTCFYLTRRTVNSNLGRIYLFNEGKYFKLVHTQSSILIENLRNSGLDLGEFAYFNGYQEPFQGPIKIWEIEYPESTKYDAAFLQENYPDRRLAVA